MAGENGAQVLVLVALAVVGLVVGFIVGMLICA
jgi:hypothetical protein